MAKKKIIDYLHYHIGCAMMLEKSGRVATLQGVEIRNGGDLWINDGHGEGDTWKYYEYFPFKPLLRSIKLITKEEAIELTRSVVKYGNFNEVTTYLNLWSEIVVTWGLTTREKYIPAKEKRLFPEQIQYLLSRNVDVFGLIEAGLALDERIIKDGVDVRVA
jgi:hypothetical protein